MNLRWLGVVPRTYCNNLEPGDTDSLATLLKQPNGASRASRPRDRRFRVGEKWKFRR